MRKLVRRFAKPLYQFFVPEVFAEIGNIARSTPAVREELPELGRLARITISWMVLSEIMLVLQCYPIKLFFDAWARHGSTLELFGWMGLISACYYFGSTVNNRMDCARNTYSEYLFVVMLNEVHRKLLSMDTAWHIENGTGDKESAVLGNAERAKDYIKSYFFEALPMKLRIVFTTLAMVLIMKSFGVFACLLLAVYLKVLGRIDKEVAPLSSEFHRDLQGIKRFGMELVTNCHTVKLLGREQMLSAMNKAKLMEYYRREVPRHIVYRKLILKPEHVVNFSRGMVYGVGAMESKFSSISFGDFALAISWMERIFSNMYRLINFQQVSRRGEPAIRELASFFAIEPSVRNPERPVIRDAWEGKVEFSNVSFWYQSPSAPIISNVSFTVEPGTFVAIVGKTGGGKSTLLDLLRRSRDPNSGTVRVDGVDLRDICLDHYRQRVIGVVPQHVGLFKNTIRWNIRLSDPDSPLGSEEVAAQMAYAEEFVLRRPDGYDSEVGDNGLQLSGGQRQRIGIARALHGNPRILILDEPTSALDAESQLAVQQAIDELRERRACTTFVAAHRFSTIRNADLILVMDEGCIVESGTHQELLERGGHYSRLHALDQAGVYEESVT